MYLVRKNEVPTRESKIFLSHGSFVRVSFNSVMFDTNFPLEVCDLKRCGSDVLDPVPQPPERRADLRLSFIAHTRQRLQFKKCFSSFWRKRQKLNEVTVRTPCHPCHRHVTVHCHLWKARRCGPVVGMRHGVCPAHSALPCWAQPGLISKHRV